MCAMCLRNLISQNEKSRHLKVYWLSRIADILWVEEREGLLDCLGWIPSVRMLSKGCPLWLSLEPRTWCPQMTDLKWALLMSAHSLVEATSCRCQSCWKSKESSWVRAENLHRSQPLPTSIPYFSPGCDQIPDKNNLIRVYLGSWYEGGQSVVVRKTK